MKLIKNKICIFRISEDEKKKLAAEAKRNKTTMSKLFRIKILKQKK